MTAAVITTPVRPITRAEAARLAEKCARVLVEQFGAHRVIPFGSVVGDSPWHSRSDIDLAVEGLDPKLYFKAWAALDELLPPGVEIDVDLIGLNETPPELRALILGEVKMPKDNRAALKLEIENELKNLERVRAKVDEFMVTVDENDEPRQVAIAKYLHDFYNGVERIFERLTVRLEGELPSGEQWHMALLHRMTEVIPDVRPAVITPEFHVRLLELLKFRHRIRHVYSYDLEWARVKERAVELATVAQQLRQALETFMHWLDQK